MIFNNNLLTDEIITLSSGQGLTLPGVLAALSRDEVEGFRALRPHQGPPWHMFLVQLAALALHRAGESEPPGGEPAWRELLRGLTPDFPDDEPWRLAVNDRTRPAFLQPPVPEEVNLPNRVATPDGLDLLITSRNHDLKQAVALKSSAEDWVFALASLQTGEGYGGAGNHGIARMNGGSSSRPMVTLAPLPKDPKTRTPRLGAWFRRDVRVLLETRERVLENTGPGFPETNGVALTWLAPWPESEQLQVRDLDVWFIEICRRVRLCADGDTFYAFKGTSKAARIAAKEYKGALDDPYAPVHKTDNKSFTLSSGDFTYRTVIELIFSGDWQVPLLARPASFETDADRVGLVCSALARGNSKTEGFKSRVIPVTSKKPNAMLLEQDSLRALAKEQVDIIAGFDKALSYALVLAAADGERSRINRELYAFTRAPRARLDQHADSIFFDYLWARFDRAHASDRDAVTEHFAADMWRQTRQIFEQALPAMPCASMFRHRAQARARQILTAMARKAHPELFLSATNSPELEPTLDT